MAKQKKLTAKAKKNYVAAVMLCILSVIFFLISAVVIGGSL